MSLCRLPLPSRTSRCAELLCSVSRELPLPHLPPGLPPAGAEHPPDLWQDGGQVSLQQLPPQPSASTLDQQHGGREDQVNSSQNFFPTSDDTTVGDLQVQISSMRFSTTHLDSKRTRGQETRGQEDRGGRRIALPKIVSSSYRQIQPCVVHLYSAAASRQLHCHYLLLCLSSEIHSVRLCILLVHVMSQ